MPRAHKIISVSIYLDDWAGARRTVKKLQRAGYTTMNLSKLIRLALKQFDPDKLPPPLEGGK